MNDEDRNYLDQKFDHVTVEMKEITGEVSGVRERTVAIETKLDNGIVKTAECEAIQEKHDERHEHVTSSLKTISGRLWWVIAVVLGAVILAAVSKLAGIS